MALSINGTSICSLVQDRKLDFNIVPTDLTILGTSTILGEMDTLEGHKGVYYRKKNIQKKGQITLKTSTVCQIPFYDKLTLL